MASSAAADSGEGRCFAASTTDQRVLGKTRGASRENTWLVMRPFYPSKYRKRGRCYKGAKALHGVKKSHPRKMKCGRIGEVSIRQTGLFHDYGSMTSA